MKNTYHIISRIGGWVIWRSGTKRARKRFHTLLSARVFGRALIKKTQNSELVIHDNSGRVVSVLYNYRGINPHRGRSNEYVEKD